MSATPEYFESRVEFEPNSGCWLWPQALDRHGYGKAKLNKRGVAAHRLAWLTYRGELPPEQCVLHRCDTPACVNPDHLFLGSQRDNMADMRAKGRAKIPRLRGEDCAQAKLTAEQVAEIRSRHAGGESQASLAREFGAGKNTILKIVHRITWRTPNGAN